MSSLKKVFFTCAIFFVALAIPTITLAYDQCEGSFTQPDGSKIIQSGVCDYAGGINIINGGAPSCSAFGKQYFSDANYHSINDDIVHCGFNGGQSYNCCAKNASSAPPVPCTTLGPSGFCNQISTGLGQIQVNPSTIIGSLFGILLSISGGIALIIIMLSGYRIVFSQGDPEKLKGAREGLTSAIIGLLFIIFSVVILQVIGVDILHLPGLNK